VPFLARDGFHFPGGVSLLLPNLVVAILQVISFAVKVLVFCWFQIMIRWTLPRFRYDQLMRLGWIGLLPLGLLNAIVTAMVILATEPR
jgi:NADH-quinone oxidoreductase subunit H